MKPIPKELQDFFSGTPYPDRPWWKFDGLHAEFKRSDGHEAHSIRLRAAIDKEHPLPPPQILVGQVWALKIRGLFVSTVSSTIVAPDGDNTVYWANNVHGPHDWTWVYTHGFLLACPYGQGPWSGPEIPQ